jgi:hypothetical protein
VGIGVGVNAVVGVGVGVGVAVTNGVAVGVGVGVGVAVGAPPCGTSRNASADNTKLLDAAFLPMTVRRNRCVVVVSNVTVPNVRVGYEALAAY